MSVEKSVEVGVDLRAERGHDGGDQARHHDAAHAPGRPEPVQREGESQVGRLCQHLQFRRVLVHHMDPVEDHQAEETGHQRPEEIQDWASTSPIRASQVLRAASIRWIIAWLPTW